jgi:lipid-binding SYLF domain-containing protein
MSGPGDQKIPDQYQEYYPPPPPGPPPAHANPLGSNPHYTTHQQSVPQHPNENPIPDYNPSQQQQYHYQPDASELYGTDDPKPTQHHAGADPAATKPSWSSRFAGLGTKVATPFNALANKMGSEAFLPGTMDKECEKAARILRGFCKDGIYSDPSPQTAPSATEFSPPPSQTQAADSKKKSRVLLTIPSKVIARAQGLAIFTTVRAGFHVSGASGSGVLIARLPDGTWSPPSGIQVHSVGAGFVVGLDIYDCVVVINTREALEAFTRTRMSLGSDLAVTAGPWGAGGAVDFGVPQGEKGKGRDNLGDEKPIAGQGPTDHVYPTVTTGPGTAPTAPLSTPATGTSKDRKPSPFREAIKKPVYSYVKSRGFYAGVQVDGTVITERKDANAAFYGDKTITVDRILRGDVRPQSGEHLWPAAARGLVEVLAGAEGWRGQGQHGQSTSQGAGYGTGAGVSGVTQGVRHLDVNAGPSTHTTTQPPTQTYEQSAKAAEAAAEARANEPLPAGPPSYYQPETHHGQGDELPPAYVDDGVPRPGVGDTKSATGP